MKLSMSFRFRVALFCVVVFLLTVLGLAILYMRVSLAQLFWLAFAYVVALPCTYVFLVQPLLAGERRLGGTKIALLAFSVMMIGGITTHTVWTVATPKWSFTVTTDKPAYSLGEEVRITAALQNLGFITHSFRSALADPVVVSVEHQPTEDPTSTIQVWYSPYRWETAQFSIAPNHSLERDFIWNQTNTANSWFWDDIHMSGRYQVVAVIPDAEAEYLSPFGGHTLFIAFAAFNVIAS